MTLPNDPMESVRKVRSRGGHDFTGGGITIRCHPEPSAGSAFRKMPRKRKIPHPADSVWNDKRRVFPQPVQSCHMCLPCNPALAAEGFGRWFPQTPCLRAPARRSQNWCQATALLNNHVWDKNQCYLRAKRSKSAIWRSISSRAASAADRMPWMRNLNSSAFDARESASSNVINSLV